MIVDDEPLARDGLRILLSEHPDVQLVAEAGNGREALALVVRVKPDLMLVDVQMPGMTGLELASALPVGCTPTIVFGTAHEDFALQAFDVHALDYILKPIDDARFAQAIRRARLQHELGGRLREIERPTKLTIRDGDATVFLPIDDIDWVEAQDYYVELPAGDKAFLIRETMQRLPAQLAANTYGNL